MKAQQPGRVLLSRVERHPSWRLLRALLREVAMDDVPGMAAQMAYHFLFALFPVLLFLVAVLGFVGQAIGAGELFQSVMAQVGPVLPGNVSHTVQASIQGVVRSNPSAFLGLGILGTLWGAASGVGALIKGLNQAYDVERPRSYWKRQLLAMLATVLLPPAAMAFLLVAVIGRTVIDWLSGLLGLGQTLTSAIMLARWPVLALAMAGGLSLVYYALPHVKQRYRSLLAGTAVATFGWLALSWGFGLYLANVGHYAATYGSLAAAIVSLLWLYLVALVVLLGAELNGLLLPEQRWKWSADGAGRRVHLWR
ncbi:MAG: YihY/virulence factor BrkB family protein [Chloroflexota bacterium]